MRGAGNCESFHRVPPVDFVGFDFRRAVTRFWGARRFDGFSDARRFISGATFMVIPQQLKHDANSTQMQRTVS